MFSESAENVTLLSPPRNLIFQLNVGGVKAFILQDSTENQIINPL